MHTGAILTDIRTGRTDTYPREIGSLYPKGNLHRVIMGANLKPRSKWSILIKERMKMIHGRQHTPNIAQDGQVGAVLNMVLDLYPTKHGIIQPRLLPTQLGMHFSASTPLKTYLHTLSAPLLTRIIYHLQTAGVTYQNAMPIPYKPRLMNEACFNVLVHDFLNCRPYAYMAHANARKPKAYRKQVEAFQTDPYDGEAEDCPPILLDYTEAAFDNITAEKLKAFLGSMSSIPDVMKTPTVHFRLPFTTPPLSISFNSKIPTLEADCTCNHVEEKFKADSGDLRLSAEPLVGTHIQTNDITVLQKILHVNYPGKYKRHEVDAALQFLALGPRIRVASPLTRTDIRGLVYTNVGSWISRVEQKYNLFNESSLPAALQDVITDFILDLSKKSTAREFDTMLKPSSKTGRIIKDLQQHVYITTREKDANGFGIICLCRAYAIIQEQLKGDQYEELQPIDQFGVRIPFEKIVSDCHAKIAEVRSVYRLVVMVAHKRKQMAANRIEANMIATGKRIPEDQPLPPPKLGSLQANIKNSCGVDAFGQQQTTYKKRMLVLLGHTASSPTQSLLCAILTFLKPHVAQVWKDLFYDFGSAQTPRKRADGTPFPAFNTQEVANAASVAHKIWFATNTQDITKMFEEFNKHAKPTQMPLLNTFDFSDLYNTLTRDQIVTAVSYFCTKIHTKRSQSCPAKHAITALKITWDAEERDWKIEWSAAPKPATALESPLRNTNQLLVLTLQEVIAMLESTLDTTFFTLLQSVFKQPSALPMGSEPAVLLADFTLAYSELIFVERLIFEKDWAHLKQLMRIKRYIDDITALMCAFFHLIKHHADQFTCTNGTIIPGIYPNNTKLNLEQSLTADSTAVIVDAEITYNRKTFLLEWSTFDKRSIQKYDCTPLQRFPPFRSLMPMATFLNIVVSESHRARYTCSHYTSFAQFVASVIHELASIGVPLKQLILKSHQYLRQTAPLYGSGPGADPKQIADKIDYWILKYYHEGSPLYNHRNARLHITPPTASAQPYVRVEYSYA